MDAKKLQKMLTSGDSVQLHKALGEISGTLEKLERDVAMLEANPIVAPQSSYRVVEKGYDDDGARGEAHYGMLNGKPVDLDALAREVQRHAGTGQDSLACSQHG